MHARRFPSGMSEIDSAEDLFALFEQSYDERVLHTHRVRILQCFGRLIHELQDRLPEASDGELRALYAKALHEAYSACTRPDAKPERSLRPRQDLVTLRLGPGR